MAEIDPAREVPMDGGPGARYRALPQDEPPSSIDATILAASRRGLATKPARNWLTPVGLAAVLVLSVGVSLRVADEKPEALRLEPPAAQVESPPAKPTVGPDAGPAESPSAREMPAKAPVADRMAPAEKQEPPASTPAPAPERRAQRNAAEAPAAAAGAMQDSARQEKAPQERSASRPAADQPPITFAPPPRVDTDAPAASSATAPDVRARTLSKSASAESALAGAAAQEPEPWLERIARLREQGRHKEADESLAEFRRQHPDYAIAPQMLQRIAPER